MIPYFKEYRDFGKEFCETLFPKIRKGYSILKLSSKDEISREDLDCILLTKMLNLDAVSSEEFAEILKRSEFSIFRLVNSYLDNKWFDGYFKIGVDFQTNRSNLITSKYIEYKGVISVANKVQGNFV